MRILVLVVMAVLASAVVAQADCCDGQWVSLTDFEAYDAGTQEVMFRLPSFSGSTAAHLAGSPNVCEISTTENATPGGSKSLKVEWDWNGYPITDQWLRLTTYLAPYLPNPTVYLHRGIRFKMYVAYDPTGQGDWLKMAIGLRETGTTADIGQNGGASGSIEWVGVTSKTAGGAPQPTRTVPSLDPFSADPSWDSDQWIQYTFCPSTEPICGFTGDGVLDPTKEKGVLEHIAFRASGGLGPFHIYLDDFEVCVPEPASLLALGTGLLGLAAVLRRRSV